MSDIFEEVEEAHRQDKVDEAWRKYGWLVWLAGAAIIAVVAFNEYAGLRSQAARAEMAGRLEAAIAAFEASDYLEAEQQFAAIAGEGTPISPLAAQYLAQVRIEGLGNTEGAIAALNSIPATDGDPIAQLALLKSAYLQSDDLSLADLEVLLTPLIVEDTAMAALAQELVAAKAFAEGDLERARSDFNFLRFAPNAPPGLAQRAEIALAAIPRPDPSETGSDAEDTAAVGDGSPGENAPEAVSAEDSETLPSDRPSPDPGAAPTSDTDDLGGR